MKLVLLSGGSGRRLWPLSNDARSKQFLRILEDQDGKMISMVQRVWRQLEGMCLSESTVIATNPSQVEMLRSQIHNEVPIIVEPERMDTFPAIALAASYYYSQGVPLEEVIAVLPVDTYVEDRFFQAVRKLEHVLVTSGANLALIGVSPTYPSSKYGYIIPERNKHHEGWYKVEGFREKPTKEQALQLIDEQDAMWNCGVFAFKLDYIISLLHQNDIPIQYEQLLKYYHQLPKISFDYKVVEQETNIAVLPYEGYWKDLGTWNTLTEEMGSKQLGRGTISQDCVNTHLINELDIPVAILGLSNVIVAVSPDGVLVSDKSASPKLKELLTFDQRPMYEEKQWGWYRVLDYTKYDEKDEVLTKRVCVKSGEAMKYQVHFNRSEIWTVINGYGELILGDHWTQLKTGDVIKIPSKVKHCLKASTDLEFIQVQSGRNLSEDDIIEFLIDWDEVKLSCITHSK